MQLLEKSVFMVLFFIFTYFITNKIILQINDENMLKEIYIKSLNKKVLLNKYEQSLLDNVTYPIENYVDEIVGYDDIKKKLDDIIIKPLLDNSDILPNGVIFYGPPGNGKTLFAKYILNKAKISFINFDIANIENKYYGESSKYMKAVFTLANKMEPCIIFIDELDGICGERSSIDQFHVNSMKTQLLKYMDGFDKSKKIICIGATNKLDIIDSAILRRMRVNIKFDLPDLRAIENMFKFYIKDDNILSIIEDYKTCIGLSCSDIHEVCKQLILRYKYTNETISLQNVLNDICRS